MQLLNKLRSVFDAMVTNAYYSYLDGDKYIQIPESSVSPNGRTTKSGAPMITPIGLGIGLKQGFIKNQTITTNLQVIDTLLQYENINNALVIVKPSMLNKNVWKAKVFIAGMKVFSGVIRFSDDKFYETQLLKWKYRI